MTPDLSPDARAANLARMGSQAFDLAVVGGGIVGAGIARDAAMRGLSVALVERGDFASGTSGKTSRLVHGGLRYLKNFKIGLVRQAVRERDLLLERAHGLVRPLAFTIPAYGGRGMGKATLRFGLFVYDFLSRDKVLPRRRWLRPAAVPEREPRLASSGLKGAGVYHDALTNDARLVLTVLRSATEAGASVANYAEAEGPLLTEGRVAGLRIRDRMADRRIDLRASVVVNAAGVWIDRLRTAHRGPPTVRPTKGIHIFLRREQVGNREAVVLNAPQDGRMLFVLPWGRLTLVGTTDTDFRGDPDRVVPDAADVAYLLECVNAAFPESHAAPADVVSAYAGLRPLIASGRAEGESDISREHEIFEDPDGLISVAGGKLTTQRAMAEEVVDLVCRRLGKEIACRTRDAVLRRAASPEAFRALGFDGDAADHLASRHDPASFRRWLGEPGARDRIVPDLPYLYSEVCEAVEAEMAATLQDVLVRRLGIFYEDEAQGTGVAQAVAERIAPHLGWAEDRVRAEVAAYGALVDDHRKALGGP